MRQVASGPGTWPPLLSLVSLVVGGIILACVRATDEMIGVFPVNQPF